MPLHPPESCQTEVYFSGKQHESPGSPPHGAQMPQQKQIEIITDDGKDSS